MSAVYEDKLFLALYPVLLDELVNGTRFVKSLAPYYIFTFKRLSPQRIKLYLHSCKIFLRPFFFN